MIICEVDEDDMDKEADGDEEQLCLVLWPLFSTNKIEEEEDGGGQAASFKEWDAMDNCAQW